jgi:hypothetical protein
MVSRDERGAAKSFTTMERETMRAIIGVGRPSIPREFCAFARNPNKRLFESAPVEVGAAILFENTFDCWSVSGWPSRFSKPLGTPLHRNLSSIR